MDRSFVALFERKVLFRISRFVALSICLLLFLALIAGGIYLAMTGSSQAARPDAAQVAQSLKPMTPRENAASGAVAGNGGETADVNSSVLQGVKVPPVLQELLLNQDNQRVFRNWLDEFPAAERQAFIDGIAKAVTEGRQHSLDDTDVINRYHERYAAYVAEKEAADAIANMQRLYIAAGLVSTLMLLALFSLVLVLLAIERNTRDSLLADAR